MALLLTEDGDLQIDDAVFPLGELGDLDGGAVGDLLIQAAQQLLPHQLRADLPLGLVGDHVVREEMRALGGVLLQLVHQLLQSLAGLGGDGQDGIKVTGRAVDGHDLQQPGLFHGVDLVDEQQSRDPGLPDALDERLLLGADGGHGLHHQQDAVHVRHALLDYIDHVVAESGPGLVEARGVQQHKLGVAPVDNGGDAVAGGLRLVRDDGDLLPHQGIGEGGLARVGPAADGNHSALLHFQ